MMRLLVLKSALFGMFLTLLSLLVPFGVRAEEEETRFTLKSDRYMLTIEATYGDQTDQKTESNIVQVTVTNDGTIKIVRKEKTIEGRIERNRFTASIPHGNGTLELSGELTANNKLTGNVSGTASDGKTNVKGTFKLKHLPQ